MIVFVAIVTTASALAFSLTQTSLYQATASVLVNNQSLIATCRRHHLRSAEHPDRRP